MNIQDILFRKRCPYSIFVLCLSKAPSISLSLTHTHSLSLHHLYRKGKDFTLFLTLSIFVIDPELGFPQKDYEENYSSQVYPVTLSWRDCNVFALPKRKLCCLCNKEEELPKRILTNGKRGILLYYYHKGAGWAKKKQCPSYRKF